jgi:hypothetical protein
MLSEIRKLGLECGKISWANMRTNGGHAVSALGEIASGIRPLFRPPKELTFAFQKLTSTV